MNVLPQSPARADRFRRSFPRAHGQDSPRPDPGQTLAGQAQPSLHRCSGVNRFSQLKAQPSDDPGARGACLGKLRAARRALRPQQALLGPWGPHPAWERPSLPPSVTHTKRSCNTSWASHRSVLTPSPWRGHQTPRLRPRSHGAAPPPLLTPTAPVLLIHLLQTAGERLTELRETPRGAPVQGFGGGCGRAADGRACGARRGRSSRARCRNLEEP